MGLDSKLVDIDRLNEASSHVGDLDTGFARATAELDDLLEGFLDEQASAYWGSSTEAAGIRTSLRSLVKKRRTEVFGIGVATAEITSGLATVAYAEQETEDENEGRFT